ncbi:GGDEF domain-containing protein [Rhodanobacter sp. 7MK24]|uniref:GGDEF domain-containing protein n=1 Tax=Rhodanobacter sp. 7MK24 TaxID=2775922 RepID=UPI0017837233|nr:GGDEF domain-containing protein [Rhodanobacter sp. 7MK24]MBD8881521.1 GGDEF domain-containing protein [Rhodanobacter sp. 7MK24]
MPKRAWLGVLGMLVAVPAAAASMDAFRERAVTNPHSLIAAVRQQLDRAGTALPPARERELLWGMGTAAINSNDDAALAEATLRLDSLAAVAHDPVAAAAAGFLQARHDIANGISAGLGEALQAANKVLGQTDPRIMAWARYQLCDAYTLDDKPDKALPVCQQALAGYRALNDEFGMGDVENDTGIALASQDKVDDAAAAYVRSREHYAKAKAGQLVVLVGDNLAKMYLKQGRAREAMALSQASLKQELGAGRISDSLDSTTDIALAEAALGQHRQAYARMREAVVRARQAGINGQLIGMLQVESRMAEQVGDLRQALDDEREASRLNDTVDTPAQRLVETELEQRYATREKELRISELEHANELKDLQLRAVKAEAERRREQQQRQRLANAMIAILAGALSLIVGLLVLLLRAQRRHAAELRAQALRDPLTGIANRRAFQQRASELLDGPHEAGIAAHVLLLIDIDHFKSINDSIGHPQGDRVLRILTDYLGGAVGAPCFVARIGGEEFAVLCPRTGLAAGMRMAERLRAGTAALTMPDDLPLERLTISIGVAPFDGVRCRDLSSWMRAADLALYAAKSGGRDRVMESRLLD